MADGGIADTGRENIYKVQLADTLMNAAAALVDLKNDSKEVSFRDLELSDGDRPYPIEMIGLAKRLSDEGYAATRQELMEQFDKGDYSLAQFTSVKRPYVVRYLDLEEKEIIQHRHTSLLSAFKEAYKRSLIKEYMGMRFIHVYFDNEVLGDTVSLLTLSNGVAELYKDGQVITYDGPMETIYSKVEDLCDQQIRIYAKSDQYPYIVVTVDSTGIHHMNRYETPREAVEHFFTDTYHGGKATLEYQGRISPSYAVLQLDEYGLLYRTEDEITRTEIPEIVAIVVDEAMKYRFDDILPGYINEALDYREPETEEPEAVEFEIEPVEVQEEAPETEPVEVQKEAPETEPVEEHEEAQPDLSENKPEAETETASEEKPDTVDIMVAASAECVAADICELLYDGKPTETEYIDVKDCVVHYDGSSIGEKLLLEDIKNVRDKYSGNKLSFEYLKSQEILGYLSSRTKEIIQENTAGIQTHKAKSI